MTDLGPIHTGGNPPSDPADHEGHAADLLPVHRLLVGLGAHERSVVDEPFEKRLAAAATAAALRRIEARVQTLGDAERQGLSSDAAKRLAHVSAQTASRVEAFPVVATIRWRTGLPLGIAAAVAILAATAWLATMPRTTLTEDRPVAALPAPSGEVDAAESLAFTDADLAALDVGADDVLPEFSEELDAILVDTTRLDESMRSRTWSELTDGALQ